MTTRQPTEPVHILQASTERGHSGIVGRPTVCKLQNRPEVPVNAETHTGTDGGRAVTERQPTEPETAEQEMEWAILQLWRESNLRLAKPAPYVTFDAPYECERL